MSGLPHNIDEYYDLLIKKTIEAMVRDGGGDAKLFASAMIPNIMPMLLRWNVNHPCVKMAPLACTIEPQPGWTFQLTGDFSQVTPQDGSILQALTLRKCPISSVSVISSVAHVRTTITGTDCQVLLPNSEIVLNALGKFYSDRSAQPQLSSSAIDAEMI